MLEIAKRTSTGALLLLILPLLVGLTGWQWQPGPATPGLHILYWITETVSRPWGVLTTLLLCGWFLWCLRFRARVAIILLLILIAAVLAGQYTGTLIKERVGEPRPFVLWLAEAHGMDGEAFYALKHKAKSQTVRQILNGDRQLPRWLKKHWESETGFAFPSGHTLFAASWVLLAAGLLWPRRHIVTVILLMVWAELVMLSRLMLGMHWSQDLIAATLISWLLVTLASWLVQRYCGPLSELPQEKADARQPVQQERL